MMDLWMVGEQARGYLTQAQLPYHKTQFQNSIPIETERVCGDVTQKIR